MWYADYIDKADETVFEIILAANFLEIEELVGLGCAKVASKIKDQPIPVIRKFFGIVNDFTPEEEAEILVDNNRDQEFFQ